MTNKTNLRRPTLRAGATVAMLVSLASPAVAGSTWQDIEPIGGPDRPKKAALVQGDGGTQAGDITTLGLVSVSPSGCAGKTNSPHISTSSATYGLVKGYGETTCTRPVSKISVETHVKIKRWYGWERSGETVPGSNTDSMKVARSGVATGCYNGEWKTVAAHSSVEGGTTYSNRTDEAASISKC